MSKLTIFTIIILLTISCSYGQKIEIGQDAKQVKSIIESMTNNRNGYDTYGNSKGNNVTWDVKYNNGQMMDVIQCWQDQYLLDFRVSVSFCKHYIMEKGQLAFILTQYEEISTEQLNQFYEKNLGNYKSGNLYFSDDYQHYSKVYLSYNGKASVEWRKTKINQLPINIKEYVTKKLKDEESTELKRKKVEEEKMAIEKEIKSMTYGLRTYNDSAYNDFKVKLRKSLLSHLKSYSSFPKFSQIENQNQKYFTFKNSYSAYYKLVDYSRESVYNGSYIMAGSIDIRQESKFTLLSGDDSHCDFLGYASPRIPSINYKGYVVMTETNIEKIDVNYAKGFTKVRIKNGIITYKKYLPPSDVQIILNEKLKSEPNNMYQIKYEVGEAMGESFVIIEKLKTDIFF